MMKTVTAIGTGLAALGLLLTTFVGGSPSAGAASSRTITIATLQPLSGPFADVGQLALTGVKLGVNNINAQGGIKALGGAKLKLITADSTSSDPVASQTVMNQLLQQHPAVIIGPSDSTVMLSASTAAESAHVPICSTAYADNITARGYKYTFELPQTASTIGKEAVPAMQAFLSKLNPGIKKVAVIGDNSAGVSTLTSSLASAIKSSNKFTLAYNQTYPIDLTNAAPIASGIKSSGAQAIVTVGQIPNIQLINSALVSAGIGNLPQFNPGGGATVTPAYAKALGNTVNGEFAQTLWGYNMKLSSAQNQLLSRLNTQYTSKSHAPFTDAFVGAGYECTQLFAAAMQKAKSTDPATIAATLHKSAFDSGPGGLWPGGVKFNAAGVNTSAVTLVGEWCHGKLQTVYPAKFAAMSPKATAACGGPKG